MDAITKALEISARALRDCDTAERDLAGYPDEQRRNGLARVEAIRNAARSLADVCLDGVSTPAGHKSFSAAVSLLGQQLEGRAEPVEPVAIDERIALVNGMYSRLSAILHVAGAVLTAEQYSASVGVLNELAVLIDALACVDSGEAEIDQEIEGFCDYAEPVFEGLASIFAGGGDER